MPDLSAIISDISSSWDDATAAGEYDPLPPGVYVATIAKGELAEHPRNGTPSFKLTFRVDDGPHAGRLFFNDLWLTPNAMSYTKRDLLKVGVTSADQLDRPLAARFRCKVWLTRHRSDGGAEFNRVKRFDVLEALAAEANPFPPDGGAG